MAVKTKIKSKPGPQTDVESPVNLAQAPALAPKESSFFKQSGFIWALVVLAALVALGFFAVQNHKLKASVASLEDKLKNSASLYSGPSGNASTQSDADLIAAVGKLIILPTDETPTIATVTDLSKLKDQPFFAQAQVGDKVLIYPKAQKAILYRPSEDKIIELAPLNLGSSQSAAQKLKVEIRNGSGVSGAAAVMKAKLLAGGNFDVVKVANAKATYPKTLLYVPDSNKLPDLVTSLRLLASAQLVTALPAGEPDTTADALVILGQQ